MIFTTSWDDGYVLDRRVVELLERYGMTGTLYICPRAQHHERMLPEAEIRLYAKHHEIGAHTLTHPHLPSVSPALCRQEIQGSKEWVERITGTECTMFCYPYGDWNDEVQSHIREIGFAGARTTADLEFSCPDPFTMPTSLQVIPFPHRGSYSRWWHPLDPFGPLRVRYRRLRKMGVPFRVMQTWQGLARHLFRHALETNQPFFHLWGHSREIQRYRMWNELEDFLCHVQQSGIQCITNGEFVAQTAQ